MNQAKRKKWFAPSLLACALLAVLGMHFFSQGNAVEQEQGAMAQEAEIAEHDDLEQVTRIQTFSWWTLPEDTLMEGASLVVHGRATGASEPFFVESTYGGRTIFTDYYIRIYETLRGVPSAWEIIVRVEGGSADGMVIQSQLEDLFVTGNEYLLFLNVPGGGVFDTPGDYYYIVGGPNGVFRKGSPIRAQRVLGENEALFIQSHGLGKEFILSELRNQLEQVNATVPPPDEDALRQMGIDAILKNIENGILLPDTDLLDEVQNRPSRPAWIVEGRAACS
ncbi:MAG: hypothetical protein FWE28_04925 [Oscillospiraceae bacterium]|nr:hypothetical protein [Oscillospiraceae bacterium]